MSDQLVGKTQTDQTPPLTRIKVEGFRSDIWWTTYYLLPLIDVQREAFFGRRSTAT